MSIRDNGWHREWHGKAKNKSVRMQNSTWQLIRLLDRLDVLPEDFDDDWEEEFRCYVNRILGLRR